MRGRSRRSPSTGHSSRGSPKRCWPTRRSTRPRHTGQRGSSRHPRSRRRRGRLSRRLVPSRRPSPRRRTRAGCPGRRVCRQGFRVGAALRVRAPGAGVRVLGVRVLGSGCWGSGCWESAGAAVGSKPVRVCRARRRTRLWPGERAQLRFDPKRPVPNPGLTRPRRTRVIRTGCRDTRLIRGLVDTRG
jgi:hypothetical protein